MRMPRPLAAAVAVAALFAPSVASSASAPAPPPPAPRPCDPGCWKPPVRTSWDWVISEVPTPPFRDVDMYDIDGFDAPRTTVAAMHAKGIKVVCYLSAGSWENWRPDKDTFPGSVLGASNGWPGERWLDIRQYRVLLPIMAARVDMCKRKGFDAIEFDNVDGYTNRTGFPLTGADQLYYNARLANLAHSRGLSVLQKNDLEQIPKLVRYFDGILNEQCAQYHECTTAQNGGFGLDQYVKAGKPAFQAEYKRTDFCPAANRNNVNAVLFDVDLDGSVFVPCRR